MATPYSTGFDAHTHLDFPAFDEDRERVLARAADAGIHGAVIAGADPANWDRVRTIAQRHDLVAVLGLHPWFVADLDDGEVDEALGRLPGVLTPHGLGELGLDRVRAPDDDTLARQRRVFHHQLDLAVDRDLPLVLHGVRAWSEILDTLAARGVPERGGMAHAWTGSPELARRAVELGLHVSFGTDLDRSRRARAAIAVVPQDRLLLETDCPDRPLSGDRGEPADLVRLAEIAADLRDERPDDVLAYTGTNARRLFGVGTPPEADSR